MKINIAGETLLLGFKHEKLEGAEFRVRPSQDEIVGALIVSTFMLDGEIDPNSETGQSLRASVGRLVERYDGSLKPASHLTQCFIKKVDPDGKSVGDPILSGIALCDKQDNFDRAIGRLVAFLKAIEHLDDLVKTSYIAAYKLTDMRIPDWPTICELGFPHDIDDDTKAKSWFQTAVRFYAPTTPVNLRYSLDPPPLNCDEPAA